MIFLFLNDLKGCPLPIYLFIRVLLLYIHFSLRPIKLWNIKVIFRSLILYCCCKARIFTMKIKVKNKNKKVRETEKMYLYCRSLLNKNMKDLKQILVEPFQSVICIVVNSISKRLKNYSNKQTICFELLITKS